MTSVPLTEDMLFRALAAQAAFVAPLGGTVQEDADQYERAIRLQSRGFRAPCPRRRGRARLALVEPS